MREPVLDTETTGLDPLNGDRIVEIGCVEIFNHIATGQTYHQYINPERAMPTGAFAVHGLSEEFLSGYPVFADVVDSFLDFIGDDQLVIHNAKFDMGFINAELRRSETLGLADGPVYRHRHHGTAPFPWRPRIVGCAVPALGYRQFIPHKAYSRRCSMPNCWPRCIWNCVEAVSARPQPCGRRGGSVFRERRGGTVRPSVRSGGAPPDRMRRWLEETAAHAAFVETLNEPIWSRG